MQFGKPVKQAHIGKRPHGREVALQREPFADRKNAQAQGEFVGSEGRPRRGQGCNDEGRERRR